MQSTDARRNLKAIIEAVSSHNKEIVVTRYGKPSVVYVSLEEYERFQNLANQVSTEAHQDTA
jgi:prevent-host-death family protein